MEKMCIIRTIKTNKEYFDDSTTSKGIRDKFISKDGNYYYKYGGRNIYGEYENGSVISERVAYEIGKALGINVLEQEIVCFPDKPDVYICKSKNFLKNGEKLNTFARLQYFKYTDIPKEYLLYVNTILIFDFIINNVDRHLNNIAIIDNGSVPPIFDNGCSLYFDLNSEQLHRILNKPYEYKKYSVSRPYANKHYTQIKLVESSGVLPKLNLNFDYKYIIDKYYKDIRRDAILKLLEKRLSYVRDMYKR